MKDLIKQVGKMILSGKFELYKVSFPIKAMSPKSILYAVSMCSIYAPISLTAAALATDPVERMKHVITSSLSWVYKAHFWDKPLNPILGETYQARLEDGTELYLEQVSHHPPISFFLQCGPDDMYRFSAYSAFSPKAHLNSIDLNVVGAKRVSFKDGTYISYTPNQDKFQNTLWGTLIHQYTGKIEFEDTFNGLTAWYEFGNGGKRGNPKDYVKGEILKNG